jgi:hypothetical protein
MGYLINIDTIKDVMLPWGYITIHRYLFTALLLNEFESFDEDECGKNPACDVEESMNLEFSMNENIIAATSLMFAMGVIALGTLTIVGYKSRK